MAVTNSMFLNQEQARQILGVSRDTLYRILKRGELPAVTIGKQKRIPITAIGALLGVGDAAALRLLTSIRSEATPQ